MYRPSGMISQKIRGTVVSRTNALGEFAWHTDGSFESKPQRFFGLHVIHPDKLGGGISLALPVDDLVEPLSTVALQILLQYEFEIQVPPEFYTGKATNRGKVLSIDPETGRYLICFRRDIVADSPSDDPMANAAAAELNDTLKRPESVGQTFSEDIFKDNVILLMDNARFLHCRTEIKDPRRLLRRVRFNGTPGLRKQTGAHTLPAISPFGLRNRFIFINNLNPRLL